MPAGRPSLYKPEFCARVIELGREGWSVAEMAADIDVSKQTIYEWKGVHPEFSDAMQRAIDLSESWWIKKGRDRLDADKFQTGLWYANMKNRFRWADKQENQISGPGGGPIQIEDFETAQQAARDKIASLTNDSTD